jgi:hypothetical protein
MQDIREVIKHPQIHTGLRMATRFVGDYIFRFPELWRPAKLDNETLIPCVIAATELALLVPCLQFRSDYPSTKTVEAVLVVYRKRGQLVPPSWLMTL